MQEANSRIGSYNGMFEQDAAMYRGIAKDNRMKEGHVIPTLGPFEPWVAPPAKTAPPAAGAAPATAAPNGVDPKVWQHMTPEERALWK